MLRTICLLVLVVGSLAHTASAQAQDVDRCPDLGPRKVIRFVVPAAPPKSGVTPVKRIDPVSRYGFEWNTPVYKAPGRPLTYCRPVVRRVVEGSNAARAGLRVNDVFILVNGEDARRGQLFPNLEPSTSYLLRVRRGDEELELPYTMGTATAMSQP